MTPRRLQGRIQATMQFVSMSAMPLAPLLAGTLLSVLGGGGAIADRAGPAAGLGAGRCGPARDARR